MTRAHLCGVLGAVCVGCAQPSAPLRAPAPIERSLSALMCTWTYEGVATRVRVEPTNDPYRVRPIDVDKCFGLKFVYVREPADVSVVNVYVYDVRGEAPLPLHQGKYAAPYADASQYGFTGLQFVYESNGDELQYFCEWQRS